MSKTFAKINELDPGVLMIVDCLNMAFRFREQHNYLDKYISMVESLRKSYSAGKVVLACDSGSSSFRKTIYPEYKQNRKDKYGTQTPEEQKEFELFFEEFNRVIQHFTESTNYPVFRFDKTEADDVAAYIVKTKKRYDIHTVILVSSDKDWDLLVQPGVSRFSYVTRKEVTFEDWNAHYEYDPEDHISIKCLTGDGGDNILGVAGIGPKKALQLVKEYGSTYDIIANLPIASKYKYISNLNAFGADALMLNYKLMDLLEFCDEAIGTPNCNLIDLTLEQYLNAAVN